MQRVRNPGLAGFFRKAGHAMGVRELPPCQIAKTCAEWAAHPANDGRAFREVHPLQTVRLKLPASITGTPHWQFRQRAELEMPATYLARLPGGRVFGVHGAVISGDDCLIGDLSREWFFGPEQHSVRFRMRLPMRAHLTGTCVTLATASGWNYYHWLLDVLPRLAIVERAGVDLAKVDWFIVNRGQQGYQTESLKMLGIPASKLVALNRESHLQCESLLAPSLPGVPGCPPAWAVEYLRENLAPQRAGSGIPKRIYLSRARSKYRRVKNDTEVVQVLAEYGFREAFLETIPFTEQIALLANAEAVVAPHGAGLSNLVFCRGGTKVVEMFSPSYVNPCFWIIANWAGLNHHCLLGTGQVPAEGHDPHRVEEDIAVDISALRQTLRAAGI